MILTKLQEMERHVGLVPSGSGWQSKSTEDGVCLKQHGHFINNVLKTVLMVLRVALLVLVLQIIG